VGDIDGATADPSEDPYVPNGVPRVLLVEDDARISDFLVRGLSSLGIEVLVTEDTEVGAFLVSTEGFDLVIVDLSLPVFSGLEVLRLFQPERTGTPVIALSARDRPESRDAVLEAGAADCLTKPLVLEELQERVSVQISSRPEHVSDKRR
jgi:two-component system copper resistance phosphate regulon response regulator CusR